jgi:hypothetical protein
MSVQEFKENTARKLAAIRCPQHRQPPRLTFRGNTLRDVTVQLSGCCSQLLDLANKAIAARQ